MQQKLKEENANCIRRLIMEKNHNCFNSFGKPLEDTALGVQKVTKREFGIAINKSFCDF